MSSTAKVGAGETAASGGARKPLLQAVRDGDFKAPEESPSSANETSVWLFEAWKKMRKRDQAALDALNTRIERIALAARARERWLRLLSLVTGVLCGALGAAVYFSIGG